MGGGRRRWPPDGREADAARRGAAGDRAEVSRQLRQAADVAAGDDGRARGQHGARLALAEGVRERRLIQVVGARRAAAVAVGDLDQAQVADP
jgi:hypothetical protein